MYWKKYRVAARIRVGWDRDRIFSGICFTFGHFWVFLGVSGYIGYHLFFFGDGWPDMSHSQMLGKVDMVCQQKSDAL